MKHVHGAGFKRMRRREFVTLFGGALATWAFAPALAQTVPVIGFLNSASRDPFTRQLVAFRLGLGEMGYVEGRNLAIEYRWAEGQYDRLPAMAADLVRRRVALIVAAGGMAAQPAVAATETIPLLLVTSSDPERLIVDVGAQPGARNISGVPLYTTLLAPKRLEFLRELVPGVAKPVLLINPGGVSSAVEMKDVEMAARNTGLQLRVISVSAESEFAPALAAAVQAGADSLLVSADPFFTSRRAQLVALAAQHRLLAAYPWREYVEAGGLMSYGPSLSEAYRNIGLYAGRILKGAAPADLPIRVPQKFELMINLRTAKTLGLNVPPMLLARVDEVIE